MYIFLWWFFFVLVFDHNLQLFNLFAEFISFLLSFSCLVFQELSCGFKFVISSFDLEYKKKVV